MADQIATCTNGMKGATWPQRTAGVPCFGRKMRHPIEKIDGTYGEAAFDYVWLARSRAKQKGNVPQTLNRTDGGREIPL